MEEKKTNVKAVVRKTVKTLLNLDSPEWPPNCYGILHQPKRPTMKKEESK